MPAQTVIKLRRDTAANWTSTDPTLAAGEAGFESDSNKLKIGDGSTAWTSLGYAKISPSDIIGVTTTAAELNILDGVTATAAELNFVDGVTSGIQYQVDSKQNELTGLTSTVAELNILDGVTATAAELNYSDGVTSAIQTQLDAKASVGFTNNFLLMGA